MTKWPKKITITEVGPRDGLQNQPESIATNTKITLVDALSETGLTSIEVSAFVHPRWVPQLCDANEVFAGITRKKGISYSALVPNERGWDRAKASGVDKIAVLASASETFCQKNTNTSIDGAIERIQPLVEHAIASGVSVRGYLSCAIACPYEGETDLQKVRYVTQRLLEIGITEIALSDTIGVAIPEDIRKLYDALDGELSPEQSILHLHDTQGRALDCVSEAMRCGVVMFDASCGGLGGCPYAPGAAGNIATEDLVHFADEHGIETGVDLQKLVSASKIIEEAIGCKLVSRVYRTFQDAHSEPNV
jgi:hydroxymethylglutaryl-CoA lyase